MTSNANWSRIRAILALLVLVLAFVLVAALACGGDDDDEGEGQLIATLPASDGGGDGDDGDDLSKLTGEYKTFQGYVKYVARGFPAEDAVKSMAIYQKGDNSRADIESSEGTVTIIDTADASYVCTQNRCLKSPAEDISDVGNAFTSFIDPATIEEQFGDADYDAREEEIAGMDATCFSAGGNEVCFGEGGLLLRVTFAEVNGSGTFEAVETDTDIPEDAFEPPFNVIDLGDLGQ